MRKIVVLVVMLAMAGIVSSNAFASVPWDNRGPVAEDPTVPSFVKEALLQM